MLSNTPLKRQINNNRLTIGTWITIKSPLIPDILSSAGFDWLCVDMEHSSIDLDDLMSLIISIENNNICPLVLYHLVQFCSAHTPKTSIL